MTGTAPSPSLQPREAHSAITRLFISSLTNPQLFHEEASCFLSTSHPTRSLCPEAKEETSLSLTWHRWCLSSGHSRWEDAACDAEESINVSLQTPGFTSLFLYELRTFLLPCSPLPLAHALGHLDPLRCGLNTPTLSQCSWWPHHCFLCFTLWIYTGIFKARNYTAPWPHLCPTTTI